MRSGNGRHRRPRQVPAIIVAAGVTGAGLAIPLFGAAGAQAAPAATWDQVAECESGGMWSANEGNGFYGGLQLTLDMWKQYGGAEYAPRPDLASRSQQISVAEAILGDRGPDAWPSCALGAGLADDAGAPDGDPGGAATPDPGTGRGGDEPGDRGQDGSSSPSRDGSETSGNTDRTDEPGATEGSEAPDASQSPDGRDGSESDRRASDGPESGGPESGGSDRSKEPSTTPSADPTSSGRHRGAPDAGERADDGGSSDARPSGRHASREAADREQSPTGDDYTVRPGDNLSGIAEHRNVARGWEGIYENNEDLIGVDPDLIIPGQRLDLTIREQ
ncbi:LysM peptidoglycan-binding domain-containing protein [Streptomyces malaysiensis]|uniref:Transglycosylase domain-containing protein n=1 Tax=Streptomyces autolyticus TaxID=75293 RepID=A0ABN4W4Z3_9ACTN|nr:transglycosylase family protein [Streptomyces autolyticus]AQA12323.1 transglycosylase domain-containing protein [Streptomyces autolyticus]